MNVHQRKRYNSGSNNNYRRQNRHRSGSSSNNSGNNFGPPRPRKNFRALQEKYLNMAKEAMASGDRILAEYYLQHADHYYRQNEEFLEERNKWHEQRAQRRTDTQATEELDGELPEETEDEAASEEEEMDVSTGGSALPAFLTRKVGTLEEGKVVPMQDWEE